MAEGKHWFECSKFELAVAWIYSQKLLFLPPVHKATCAGINPFSGRGNFSETLLKSKGAKRQRYRFGVQIHFICAIIAFKYDQVLVVCCSSLCLTSHPVSTPASSKAAEQCRRSGPHAEPFFYIYITNCWYCSLISVSEMPCQACQGAHQCPLDSFSPRASASC